MLPTECFTTYHALLTHLARAFYRDQPPAERARLGPQDLLDDLAVWLRTLNNRPSWEAWLVMHEFVARLQQREARLPRACRLAPATTGLISNLGLHQREGAPALRLPWRAAVHLSAADLDADLCAGDLCGRGLPDNLWIEWTDHPPPEAPGWIRQAAGLLLSRLCLFDAPGEIQSQVVCRTNTGKAYRDSRDALQALLENAVTGNATVGYLLTVAQRTENGFSSTAFCLGHGARETLRDLLDLCGETGVREHWRNREDARAWIDFAVRLLLACRAFGWLAADRQVELTAHDWPPNTGAGRAFRRVGERLVFSEACAGT